MKSTREGKVAQDTEKEHFENFSSNSAVKILHLKKYKLYQTRTKMALSRNKI